MVDAVICGVYAMHYRGRIHTAEHPENTSLAVHKPAGLKSRRPLFQCVAWNRLLLRVHRLVAADRGDPALDTADIAHRSTALFSDNSEYRRSDECRRIRGNVARDNLYVARGRVFGRLGVRSPEADHLLYSKGQDAKIQAADRPDPTCLCGRRDLLRTLGVVDPTRKSAQLFRHDRYAARSRCGLWVCCRNSLLADARRCLGRCRQNCARMNQWQYHF